MPLVSGAMAAGFTIVRPLGRGQIGELYLAEHARLPRRHALEILPADVSADPEYRGRFNRESDLAAALWHPHIVSLHDRGEFEGRLWLSMDYVDGADAARLLSDTYPDGMPPDAVIEIVSAIADALDYAHDHELLHRCVRPSNILITDRRRILLAGFGVAQRLDDINSLTQTSTTVGTMCYAAPEQLMGDSIDGRADQYALAGTAFHLLTGSPPFAHANPAVVISKHLNESPPRPGDVRPQLTDFDEPFVRALAKVPNDRFSRCQDFAKALEPYHSKRSNLRDAVATRPTQPPAPAPKYSPTATTPQNGDAEDLAPTDLSLPATRNPRTAPTPRNGDTNTEATRPTPPPVPTPTRPPTTTTPQNTDTEAQAHLGVPTPRNTETPPAPRNTRTAPTPQNGDTENLAPTDLALLATRNPQTPPTPQNGDTDTTRPTPPPVPKRPPTTTPQNGDAEDLAPIDLALLATRYTETPPTPRNAQTPPSPRGVEAEHDVEAENAIAPTDVLPLAGIGDAMSFAEPDAMSFAEPDAMSFAEPDAMSFAEPDVMTFPEPAAVSGATEDLPATSQRRRPLLASVVLTVMVVVPVGLLIVMGLRSTPESQNTPTNVETPSSAKTIPSAPPAPAKATLPPTITAPTPRMTTPPTSTAPSSPATIMQPASTPSLEEPVTPVITKPPSSPRTTPPAAIDSRPAVGMPCGPQQTGSTTLSNTGVPVSCVGTPGGFAWE
jgi:serine/threonine protein kinase, bacterial